MTTPSELRTALIRVEAMAQTDIDWHGAVEDLLHLIVERLEPVSAQQPKYRCQSCGAGFEHQPLKQPHEGAGSPRHPCWGAVEEVATCKIILREGPNVITMLETQ